MGFSPVLVREAETGAFVSAFWRVLFALPVLAAWAYIETKRQNLDFRIELSTPAIIAGFMFAGDLIFWHLAILNTTMANATFMVCLAPVWVAVFSNVFLGEKTGTNAVFGILLCLAGLSLLINSSIQFHPDRLTGDIYGLITSFFLGSYFIAMRFSRQSETARVNGGGNLFFASTLVTCVVLFVAASFSGQSFMPDTNKGWISLISLGVFTHAGGQGLVTIALGSLTAVFSSLVIFIEAIAAALFGWWLFDEAMGITQMVGGALILSGVWCARPRNRNT